MDFPGLDDEINVIVGRQRAESFGNTAKFELHESQSTVRMTSRKG
jgi:hypothetical protein